MGSRALAALPVAQTLDLPMDDRMDDVDRGAIGPLWIRRQVFEHSVAVPLLTLSKASQIDFVLLAEQLIAANVISESDSPPAITYDAWVTAAGLHARLDSSQDAGIIIEALETNAPDAFVRCNDPAKLAPGRQLNYRFLLIPVPELLAFLRLHAAATVASRFREQADTVWPDSDPAVMLTPQAMGSSTSLSPTPNESACRTPNQPTQPVPGTQTASPRPSQSPNPISPRLLSSHPPSSQSSPRQQPPAPPNGPGLDGLRKKTPTHLSSMVQSQSAIIASVQHAFQRETRLVVSNLRNLLLTVASAYGVAPTPSVSSDTISHESGIVMGGGTVAVESGTLDRQNLHASLRRANSLGSGQRAVMMEENAKNNLKNIPITKQMFENLAFLLTTICDPSGSYRPISWIVPQWREDASSAIALDELVETVSNAITRIPLAREIEGSTDVAEIRDIDRRTIIRSSIPTTNASVTGYPHASEIRISNCSDSQIYLLCSLGRVSCIACRDCTFFIGACVSISLINCVNIRLHAIARVCRVTNCFDSHLYLCTNRHPQIVGEDRGLVFAPYNAAYTKAEVDKLLAAVGVDPGANVWDKFYRPSIPSAQLMDKKDPDLTHAVATVLPPEKFLPFAVPVRSSKPLRRADDDSMHTENDNDQERDATTRMLFSIPLPLPAAYQEQLVLKSSEMFTFRSEIREMEKKHAAITQTQADSRTEESDSKKDVAMSDGTTSSPTNSGNEDQQVVAKPTKRTIFQVMVNQRFREWLTKSGRIRQLNDLVRLEEAQSQRIIAFVKPDNCASTINASEARHKCAAYTQPEPRRYSEDFETMQKGKSHSVLKRTLTRGSPPNFDYSPADEI